MCFADTRRSEQDHIGAAAQEVECEEMLELHAVKLGWPVPVPAGHGFDHGEASVVDTTLDTFVVTQGDLTGDELLKELEVGGLVASGLFSTLPGIFEQIAETQGGEVVL